MEGFFKFWRLILVWKVFFIVMSNDPRKGEGWDFMDDESDAWYDAFETCEDENGNVNVDVDAYDGFGNIHELVNFVAGTGTYQDTRQFTPGQEDLADKKRELKNDQWKVPSKLERIEEYLEQGAMRGEVDVDPNAKVGWNISEAEAHLDDAEVKYTAHFIAYNPEEDGDDEKEHFYFSGSWYDIPPEDMNLEDIFDSVFGEEEKEDG